MYYIVVYIQENGGMRGSAVPHAEVVTIIGKHGNVAAGSTQGDRCSAQLDIGSIQGTLKQLPWVVLKE
jgi:hypothetical protein